MATSAEIAEQIAAQQSWFMQQNAMSAQVGINPMAYGGGLGGWGMGGMAPAMPPHPGMGRMPGAFNYGNTFGYGAGNRFGAAMGAGISMMPAAIGTAGMAHSMLYGSGAAPLFNPMGAFGMARGAGMGLGASTAFAGASMLPMMAVGHMAGGVVSGMQQQSMMNTAVGNYNFANPQSMTGFGFSRMDAANIGQQVRQLAMLPELFSSVQEISRILPQLKTMGFMQGVRDAGEFNKRLKDAIGTMRDVSRIIGSSLEEAGEFFAHSRSVGFFGRQAQIQNAMNAKVTGSLTGMDTQQFMAMQQQGAAFGTAVGGSRALGTMGVTAISNRIGAAIIGNSGLQQTIENITGQTGAAAVGSAAGMMLNLGQRVAGTGPGRFLMAGFMRFDENGQIQLDQDLLERQQRGELGMNDIRSRGMRNMSNRNFVTAFERRQTRLGQQFAAAGGGESMLSLLQGAGLSEDAAAIMLQRYGFSEEQVDLAQAMLGDSQSGMGAHRKLVSDVVARQARRREQGPGGLMKRIGTVVSNKITQPFEKAGADIHQAAGAFVDEIYSDLFDDVLVQATERGKKDFIAALMGSKDAAARSFSKGSIGGGASAMSGLRDLVTGGQVSPLLSDFAAWINSTGTNGTGRTAENELRKLGLDIGAGTNRENIKTRIGELINRGANEYDINAVNVLAADNKEFYGGDNARKLEIAAGHLSGLGHWSRTGEWRSYAEGVQAAIGTGQFSADDLMGGPGRMDQAALIKAGRDTRDAMNSRFGASASQIMNSEGASDLMNSYFEHKGTPAERLALKKAITNGKVEEVKSLTGLRGLTGADLRAVTSALEESGGFGADTFRNWKNVSRMENQEGMADALRGIAEDARTVAKHAGGSAVGEALSGFASAAGGMADNWTQAGFDKLGASVEAVAKAVEAITDPEKRSQVIAGLPASLKGAVIRRSATKKGIAGLANKGHASVGEIMKATGLSEKEIGLTLLGDRAGDLKSTHTLAIDAAAAGKLQSAVTAQGAASLIGAGAEDIRKRDKENQQIVLFRQMTEALVAVAKHGNKDFTTTKEYDALQARQAKEQQTGSGKAPGSS